MTAPVAVKKLPDNVAQAVATLREALQALNAAGANGYGDAIIVPGDVVLPEPFQITVRPDPGLINLEKRPAVLWPAKEYSAWKSAWETVVGYAGWWGPRTAWPLGDGLLASVDPKVAATTPVLAVAVTAFLTTTIIISAPTWRPDVNPWAVGAPIIFAGGLATALIQGVKWFKRMSGPSATS